MNDLVSQLKNFTLPPCIHIHSPFSPARTSFLVRSILNDAPSTSYASIDGVECLSQRLFFDRILNTLAGWHVSWDTGYETFGSGSYSGDINEFIEGLRAVARDKGTRVRLVLVLDRAERFRDHLPELMVPLTRLAELSRLPVTTIFISQLSWFDLRPPHAAALDPFLIHVPCLNQQDTISTLVSLFPQPQTESISPYSPSLKPLYAHYAAALYSVCSSFLLDVNELAYLAAACWPNFVSPVLADWRAQASEFPEDNVPDPASYPLPDEEARMRLLRHFTPFFTRALETLYPREQHAAQWARENAPPPDLRLSELLAQGEQNLSQRDPVDKPRLELTSVAKYVLVAAFLASHNPPKTDTRFFGRTSDERKKRRGGGPRKPRAGGIAKVPQRLLGPAAFPLDRLLAILGSLMEEHDEDIPGLGGTRDDDEDDYEQEKDTEMAVGRIQVSGTILELVNMGLLHRTTAGDKLDGPPGFKCAISQARAFELARELGIGTLADLMWDVNQ